MIKCKLVPLGDYINPCDERNTDLKIKNSQGISNLKVFQTPKQVSVNSASDKIVRKGWFAYNRATTRNGEKISIAYREGNDCTVSSAYQTFYIKNTELLNPYFLWMFFRRPEFDRYARYMSKGSAHEFFEYEDMCRVMIPLPSIDEQQKVVNAWRAYREIKEQNEAIYTPLMQVCQSYIQELKHKYKSEEIGGYITRITEKNIDGAIKSVRGMSTEKEFRVPNSRVDKENLTNYKIIRQNDFVFVPTTDTWKCLAICLSREDEPFVVSPIYEAFSVDTKNIVPEYLHLYCKRKELDRYARFHSWGSARENFNFEDMKRVKIPLPPIEIQQAIVNIYNCANEAKRIAEEADRKSREICPALIQHVINN